MISLFVASAVSLLLCLVLVPLARTLASRFGLVDQPDGHRKMHRKPTPVSGGLAILTASVFGVLTALLIPDGLGDAMLNRGLELVGLLVGGVVICAVGVADDLGYLRGRHKLFGQIVAVCIVLAFGDWVHTVQLFGFNLELGWFGIPFTIFLLLGAINSLNLIDGMDGLLGSVGVILSLALAAMAWQAGHPWAAIVALALAGALGGFLRYNLPPASIFMGDAGSMLVGLILGTLAIQCSLKAPATIALAMPIGLLILPIFDTAAAIVRRKLTGRSIYTTDRGHLHHCLLRFGFSTSGALVVVSVCCFVACAGVLASQAFNNDGITLLTAASLIATLVITRLFGHPEAMLILGRLMSMLTSTGNAQQMEVRLQGSVAWKDLWQSLKLLADELNLQRLLLDVNAPALHEGYHARWDQVRNESEERPSWYVEIPLTAQGHSVGRLVMAGQPDQQPVWNKIALVMKVFDDFALPVPSPGETELQSALTTLAVSQSKDAATESPTTFTVEALRP